MIVSRPGAEEMKKCRYHAVVDVQPLLAGFMVVILETSFLTYSLAPGEGLRESSQK